MNKLLELIDLIDDIEFDITNSIDSWILKLPKHPGITLIIHQYHEPEEEVWISWNNFGKIELYYGTISEMAEKLKNIIYENTI